MAPLHQRSSAKRAPSDDAFVGPRRKQRKAPSTPARSPGKGLVAWNRDMRRFLLELRTQCVPAMCLRLFKQRFETELRAYGVWETLNWHTLYAQCKEKDKGKNADWNAISTPDVQELKLQRLVAVEVQEMRMGPTETARAANATAQTGSSDTSVMPGRIAVVSPTAIQGRLSRSSKPVPRTPLSQQAPIAHYGGDAASGDPGKDTVIAAGPRMRSCAPATPPATPQRSTALSNTSLRSSDPVTPSRSCRAYVKRATLPKVPFPRPCDETSGSTLMLTHDEHARATADRQLVPEALARSPPGALFYRYFDSNSQGQSGNSERGFIARKYRRHRMMYMPPPAHPDWNDIIDHVEGIHFPSPFISVSNALWFILRRALQQCQKGITDGKVAVIAVDRLDPAGCYYLAPFHRELKKAFAYQDGHWNYHASQEWLIHREIPGSAILHTFQVSELLKLLHNEPVLSKMLHVDLLTAKGDWKAKHLIEIRKLESQLTPVRVVAIAHLSDFMGIHSNREIDEVSQIVAEVLHGWAFKFEKLDWQSLASVFARALLALRSPLRPARHAIELEQAFLDGVYFGNTGPDSNVRHLPERVDRLQKRAMKVGLEDRGQIVLDGIEKAKEAVGISTANRRKLFERFRLLPRLSPRESRATATSSSSSKNTHTAPRLATADLAAAMLNSEDEECEETAELEEAEEAEIDEYDDAMVFEMNDQGMVMA